MSDAVEDAMLRCYRGVPAKVLANAGDVSEATAKRWRAGNTTPESTTLIRLMDRCPPIREAVLRLLGLDDERLAAEEARLIQQLIAYRQKRSGGNGETPATQGSSLHG